MTAVLDPFFAQLLPSKAQGVPAPDDWQDWLKALFPKYVTHPFAERHTEFWEWLWKIELQSSPDPFVGIWPRGGAKSTSAELGTVALGTRNCRRYALYVRMTQEQADRSVGNIAAMLESQAVERHYPEHARRMVGKYGASKGWRRERIRTEGGFTVDALGLDTASRGVKVDEQRPDLIVFDDIDDKLDSPATTAKKIAIITTSILPAGSSNVAVLAIQNLIIPDGFFTRMVDGRADYLARRHVSGPHPAVADIETEWRHEQATGIKRAYITSGIATWEGQSLSVCQKNIDEWGLSAFMKEAQHSVKERSEGVVLRFEPRHMVDMTDEQILQLVKLGQVFGGVDFGAWRFGFTLWAADQNGIPHRIDEYFSQREGLEARAKAMHAIWQSVGSPVGLRIWGDAANPTDIMELNANFKRIGSRLRVVPVGMENKIRKASVERLNELLDRDALKFVRSVTSTFDGKPWLFNYNAASGGTPMEGSRLVWEMEKWSYPIPKEGIAQAQDPDDNTADGADMIASMRYAIMSWWRAAKLPEVEQDDFNQPVTQEMRDIAARPKLNRRRSETVINRPSDPDFGDY